MARLKVKWKNRNIKFITFKLLILHKGNQYFYHRNCNWASGRQQNSQGMRILKIKIIHNPKLLPELATTDTYLEYDIF